jgi:hypothetical protein
MTTYKPIFLRPVEIITGTNDTIKCRVSGGGSYTSITIPSGVYTSIFSVIRQFSIYLLSDGFTQTWTIEDGGDTDGRYLYIKITFGSAHEILIDQEETARMLGWTYNTSTGAIATVFQFSYQTGYCWIPRFQVANQGRFYRQLSDEVSGKITRDGSFAGNSTGPTISYRDLEFQNEKAFNLFEEAANKELYYNGSDVTKNLQYFVKQSMTVAPSVAGNPSPRGFWYVPDWNNVLGTNGDYNQGPNVNFGTDDIGIRFDLATDPDLWEFCQFEETAIEPPLDVGVPTGRELYNQANMRIHTAEYSTSFTNPDIPE